MAYKLIKIGSENHEVIEAKVKEILTGLKDKANDYEEENESEMF